MENRKKQQWYIYSVAVAGVVGVILLTTGWYTREWVDALFWISMGWVYFAIGTGTTTLLDWAFGLYDEHLELIIAVAALWPILLGASFILAAVFIILCAAYYSLRCLRLFGRFLGWPSKAVAQPDERNTDLSPTPPQEPLGGGAFRYKKSFD